MAVAKKAKAKKTDAKKVSAKKPVKAKKVAAAKGAKGKALKASKPAKAKKAVSVKKTSPAATKAGANKSGTVKKAAPKKVVAKKPAVKTKVTPVKKVVNAKKAVAGKKVVAAKKAVPTKKKPVAKALPVKKAAVKKVETKKAAKAAPVKKAVKKTVTAEKITKKPAKTEVKVKGGVQVKKAINKEEIVAGKKPTKKEAVYRDEIKTILLEKRSGIFKEINENRERESDSLKRDIGDIYDEASSERERELSLLLGDRDRQKIIEIDEALERIESGEYGICESCGENIAPARLKAQPFTKLCIVCKAEEERHEARLKRLDTESIYRNMSYGEEEEG